MIDMPCFYHTCPFAKLSLGFGSLECQENVLKMLMQNMLEGESAPGAGFYTHPRWSRATNDDPVTMSHDYWTFRNIANSKQDRCHMIINVFEHLKWDKQPKGSCQNHLLKKPNLYYL